MTPLMTGRPDCGITSYRNRKHSIAWLILSCAVSSCGDSSTSPTDTHRSVQLTVTKAGDGTGTVTSTPVRILCGPTCVADFDEGTMVTLTVDPGEYSEFVGWSGACAGIDPICELTMSEATSVTVTFDDMLAGFVDSFESIFGLTVPRPALVRSEIGPPAAWDYHDWIATAYLESKIYRVMRFSDGRFQAESWLISRPQGTFRVMVVAVDHGNTTIADVLQTGWVAAQDSVNRVHASFAQAQGLQEPIVSFVNTNILAPAVAIADPSSAADVYAYLVSQGITDDDFDILVSLDLDAETLSGGFAYSPANFVYMGCFFCTTGDFRDLTPDNLSTIAWAIYQHEIAHLWGWEHEWTACGPQYLPELCQGFITRPELFGWTDTDGDGIPEILDPDPYGT